MSPRTEVDRVGTWHPRAVLHVDLDAFFAAVEQLDHPEWRGKPVIVGGDPSRRGVVSTASYEARRFGVRSAMPSARAVRLCPRAIWAPARFDRYAEISRAVRAIFESETPRVQPLSIDEAFLDITPGIFSDEDPVAIATRIRARVALLGVTCSAGLATCKTVAKIASDFRKPDSLTIVRPGEEAAFLAPMSVAVMNGIGPQTVSRLERLGVLTLGELAALDAETAREVLGSHGPGLVLRAKGLDEREVHANEPAKSVSNERTFARDLHEPAELDEALESLARRVETRLKAKGLAGRTVTVKLRFGDFTTRTAQRTLPSPTASASKFLPIARELLSSVWSAGVGVRLLGVGLSGFEERAEQMALLSEPPRSGSAEGGTTRRTPTSERIARGVDAVRDKFGDGVVRLGREVAPPPPSDASESGSEPNGKSNGRDSSEADA